MAQGDNPIPSKAGGEHESLQQQQQDQAAERLRESAVSDHLSPSFTAMERNPASDGFSLTNDSVAMKDANQIVYPI